MNPPAHSLPRQSGIPLPYGKQTISAEDVAAVVAVMQSPQITQGPVVELFEQKFAEQVGARYAIAVNNATSALQLALRVAKIGAGDRVVTSPITFLASANAAALLGATPDFADVDPITHTLDPRQLEAGWQDDTRAVVAVDYAGQACNLPEISRIARARGAIVISDACHAIGGSFHVEGDDRAWRLGGNPWADFTVFSFHPVKSMTTGEGGMLVTDNQEWADRARALRTHGMVRDPGQFVIPADDPVMGEKGPWYYEMQDLGWNFRLTDIQAALGLSQLNRLDGFLARRREIVAAYNAAFSDLDWLRRPELREARDVDTTSWHLYTVEIDFARLARTRSEVIAETIRGGVAPHVLYIPVHLQPWYRRNYGYAPGKCPVAEGFYLHALCLPLYPTMTEADVQRVVTVVRSLASKVVAAA